MKHRLPKPKSSKAKSDMSEMDQPELLDDKMGNLPAPDSGLSPDASQPLSKPNLPVSDPFPSPASPETLPPLSGEAAFQSDAPSSFSPRTPPPLPTRPLKKATP